MALRVVVYLVMRCCIVGRLVLLVLRAGKI